MKKYYEVFADKINPKLVRIAEIDRDGELDHASTLSGEIERIMGSLLGAATSNAKSIAKNISDRVRVSENTVLDTSNPDLEIEGSASDGIKITSKKEDGSIDFVCKIVRDISVPGMSLYKIIDGEQE